MLRAAQFAARFDYELTRADGGGDARRGGARSRRFRPSGSATSSSSCWARASPSVGIEILRTTGVLAHLWPELLEGVGVDQNEWHAYDVYRHNLATLDAAPPGD